MDQREDICNGWNVGQESTRVRGTLHWALSSRPGDRCSELLEVIEGHPVLLRPEAAGQLGGRSEAEWVSPELPGLSPVTSEAKHGQPRHRGVNISQELLTI